MKTYALYRDGQFVVAQPLYTPPTSSSSFGVAELPTSNYEIVSVEKIIPKWDADSIYIKATIDVCSKSTKIDKPTHTSAVSMPSVCPRCGCQVYDPFGMGKIIPNIQKCNGLLTLKCGHKQGMLDN